MSPAARVLARSALPGPRLSAAAPEYAYDVVRRPLPLAGGDPDLVFVLLNPTVVGGPFVPATLRRCDRLAMALGHHAYRVLHLFGLVASHPSQLAAAHAAGVDVVGPGADGALARFVPAAARLVVAWGGYRSPRVAELVAARAAAVADRLAGLATCPLECFGTFGVTRFPVHPLFVRAGTPLRAWSSRPPALRHTAHPVAATVPAPSARVPEPDAATRPTARATPAARRRRPAPSRPARRPLVHTPRSVAPAKVRRQLPSLAEERRVILPLL